MSGFFCVPIVARTTLEALGKMVRAEQVADILELRLDIMEEFALHNIIKAAPKPVLVTCRSKEEGGGGFLDVHQRASCLLSAIHERAAFVDVEFTLPLKLRREILENRGRSKIILSSHLINGTPSVEELQYLLRKMTDEGPDIVKVVTQAHSWQDNLRVLSLIPQALERGLRIIAFCMGPRGRISRIFSHVMGSYVSFVSLEKGQESADGQISIGEMKKVLEILSS
jgi:3-dehydroquinate dehydratase type I